MILVLKSTLERAVNETVGQRTKAVKKKKTKMWIHEIENEWEIKKNRRTNHCTVCICCFAIYKPEEWSVTQPDYV